MNDYRILVVDDEEDLCEILKFNLENEGYEAVSYTHLPKKCCRLTCNISPQNNVSVSLK